jgi:hypothetical protein
MMGSFMRGLSVVLLSGLMLGGTQSPPVLTDPGRQISFINDPKKYPLCVPRGELNSTILTSSRNGYREAMNQLLNTAAGLGSTHVSIDSSESNAIVTKIGGTSYFCPEDFAQQPSDQIMNRDNLIIVDDPILSN